MMTYPKNIDLLLYYQAFKNYFTGIPDHNGDVIPIVPATTDRAFATAEKLLDRAIREKDEERLLYPLLSFYMISDEPDPSRGSILPYQSRYGPDLTEITQYEVMPYNLVFQLDLWCPDQITSIYVSRWIDMQLGSRQIMLIPIDFSPFFDFQRDVHMFKTAKADHSDLEGGADKEFRITWDFQVQGYLLGMESRVKTMIHTQVEVADPKNENDFEEWVFHGQIPSQTA